MKATSLPMVIAVAGAGLLAWRIGGAIGAEIAYEAPADGAKPPWFIFALFAACALVPGIMLWSVVRIVARPDRRNARRVAIAAAVGTFYLLPAVLHFVGDRSNAAPTLFPWAIVAFLGYRYFFPPSAVAAVQQST